MSQTQIAELDISTTEIDRAYDWRLPSGSLFDPVVVDRRGHWAVPEVSDLSIATLLNTDASRWRRATQTLSELARMPEDWDGEGSCLMCPQVLRAAAKLLTALRVEWVPVEWSGSGALAPTDIPAPAICPISGGTLQFEWRSGSKYFEIEFVSSDEVAILSRAEGEYRQWAYRVNNEAAIRQLLRDWIMK